MKTYLAKERLSSGGYTARGRYFGIVRGDLRLGSTRSNAPNRGCSTFAD